MNRAYATLAIKGTTESNGKRLFSGVASTPSTDRSGDIVEPKGAVFKLPIPLLWQHDSRQPIGWITSAKVTDKGIEVEGEVASIDEDGTLKSKLTEAWQMLKAKLVRGLSIGFNPIEHARIDGTYGQRFLKWEWLELSAVTIAANQDASITAIKSADRLLLAASGHGQQEGRGVYPGVSGTKYQSAFRGQSTNRNPKGDSMKTMKELNELRLVKAGRLQELLEGAKAESRTLTEDEGDEFDAIDLEVKEIDADLRQMRFDSINSARATVVEGRSAQQASRSRGPAIVTSVKSADPAFLGQMYTRRVIAKAMAHLEQCSPVDIAKARWGRTDPLLVDVIKADVAGGGSGAGEWGAELVSADNRYSGDFLQFLYGLTVYDRIAMREVPANISIKGQDGQGTGYWVGESKPIPATALDFSAVALTPLKVAALAVVSNELLRDSSPAAEMLVRDALGNASSQRVDQTFLSTTAASAGVSPAGMLNGVTIGASSGTSADNLRSDIAGLVRKFILQKNVSGLTFVTTPTLALQIQLLRNALGQREFEGVSMTGGTLEGMGLVTGDNVGAGDLILLQPKDIYKIADSGLAVSISRDAMIEQDSAPTGATDTPVGASTKFTSMFQAESTAIKVVRSINFAKRRTGAVHYIGNADYGTATSI